jgi:hypothetical protein
MNYERGKMRRTGTIVRHAVSPPDSSNPLVLAE